MPTVLMLIASTATMLNLVESDRVPAVPATIELHDPAARQDPQPEPFLVSGDIQGVRYTLHLGLLVPDKGAELRLTVPADNQHLLNLMDIHIETEIGRHTIASHEELSLLVDSQLTELPSQAIVHFAHASMIASIGWIPSADISSAGALQLRLSSIGTPGTYTQIIYMDILTVRCWIVTEADGSNPSTTVEDIDAAIDHANVFLGRACLRIEREHPVRVIPLGDFLQVDGPENTDPTSPGCEPSVEMQGLASTPEYLPSPGIVDAVFADSFSSPDPSCGNPVGATQGKGDEAVILLTNFSDNIGKKAQNLSHEVLHALGLMDSVTQGNIMFYSIDGSGWGLTAAQLSTLWSKDNVFAQELLKDSQEICKFQSTQVPE